MHVSFPAHVYVCVGGVVVEFLKWIFRMENPHDFLAWWLLLCSIHFTCEVGFGERKVLLLPDGVVP